MILVIGSYKCISYLLSFDLGYFKLMAWNYPRSSVLSCYCIMFTIRKNSCVLKKIIDLINFFNYIYFKKNTFCVIGYILTPNPSAISCSLIPGSNDVAWNYGRNDRNRPNCQSWLLLDWKKNFYYFISNRYKIMNLFK